MRYINKCLICGNNNSKILFFGKDYFLGNLTELFPVVRCRNCGFIYIKYQPEENQLQKFYPEKYY